MQYQRIVKTLISFLLQTLILMKVSFYLFMVEIATILLFGWVDLMMKIHS